jgi:hypothetical protein
MENIETYIPIEECKNGCLYHIYARNSNYGIYSEKEKGFIILRTKWKSEFLFVEFHWDTGFPYGTVKPLKEIENSNIENLEYNFLNKETNSYTENKIIFDYLQNMKDNYEN